MTRSFDRDLLRVGTIAAVVSVYSLLFYYHRGQILLYGDAVAHINIARRVFDSATPGLLQLGTVWLPLPHLLMIPFLFVGSLWQSGLGGSLPSMIAYVLGAVGVFRLARGVAATDVRTGAAAHAAGWMAALVYGLNPNLIYLQTTAMTESVYLALFIWAVVYFVEFSRETENPRTTKHTKVHEGKHRALWKCMACVAAAELTRYDGWFLAGAIGAVVAVLVLKRWQNARLRRSGFAFLLGIAVAPGLWVTYNAVVYQNPWEFANGPYSARAIEQKSGAANPAGGNALVAGSYFLKSAELSVANGNWGRLWLSAAIAALALGIVMRSLGVSLALLWTPLLFYAISIAHGGVPLYIPTWWPFTWYNIRYGVQLLPLFAVSVGILAALGSCAMKKHGWALTVVAGGLVFVSYGAVWRTQPLCLTEAMVNSRTRLALEDAVVSAIEQMPHQARYLMFLGSHVGVFEKAGIPLRQVVNEGNHRPWIRPFDPEGLWERALADPPRFVDYVIAFDGDEVDRRVNRSDLTLLSVIHASGQAEARIYQCRAQRK
jgi:hypothetical protein